MTAVRLHIVNSLACAAGGFGAPPVRVAERLARGAMGRPGSRLLFSGHRVHSRLGVNGVMVRYLDYNDAGGGGHPSDTASALLAVADAHHLPGSRLATAIVIADERGRHRGEVPHTGSLEVLTIGCPAAFRTSGRATENR
jgi:2-methylcitrate dehydratase